MHMLVFLCTCLFFYRDRCKAVTHVFSHVDRQSEPDCLRFATKEFIKLAASNCSPIFGLKVTSGHNICQSAAEPSNECISISTRARNIPGSL